MGYLKYSYFMETIKSAEAEQARKRDGIAEENRKLIESLELSDIPVYTAKDDHDKSNYVQFRKDFRKRIENRYSVHGLRIACDHCETELYEKEKYSDVMSVACPGCGWIGYMPLLFVTK
jgi:RNase P subunit RPR2